MTEDGQLLENYARHGDVASLSELVGRNTKWLIAFLRGLVPTEADAEDAFQEVWVRVIRSGRAYRGGSVKAYLARIARSVVIDRFRRAGVPTVSVDAADGEATAEEVADASPTPSERFESCATSADVRAAVRALPLRHREVLLMRIEGEMAFKEIAAELGVPIGTVLTWMRSATLKLKEVLGERR